jgi:hypothetical protein
LVGSRSAVTLIGPVPTIDRVAVDRHLAGEAAVHAVVAEQVGVGLDRPRSLMATTSMSLRPDSIDGAQHQAADAAEPVDGDLHGHGVSLLPGSAVGGRQARRFFTAAGHGSA